MRGLHAETVASAAKMTYALELIELDCLSSLVQPISLVKSKSLVQIHRM